MTDQRSGREPSLSGMPFAKPGTGNEPGLGGEHGLKLIRAHVMGLLNKSNTTHLRRSDIGEWLASVGDDRPGVGLTEAGLPDVVWCPVSGGDITLRDVSEAVHVERFYLAKYPVTWGQYRIFLEDPAGHENLAWWDGLLRRPEYERQDALWENHPAQEVSWYDAVAYCRWLSSKLGYEVRLPTEAEWQHAATGGDPERIFPWGNETGDIYANTKESRLRRATAVGMYPAGESPFGVMDMGGTVLEWCANEYYNPETVKYGEEHRVYRGGSWFLEFRYARNVTRIGNDPYLRFNSVGFRLAAGSLQPRPLESDSTGSEMEVVDEEISVNDGDPADGDTGLQPADSGEHPADG